MPTQTSAPPPSGKLSKYDTAEFARARQVAHSRLYPSIFASNYLVLSNRRVHMQQLFSTMQTVGKVLDVGAQYCPYYPLFQHKCESYTSLDLMDTPIVDLVCNAEDMQADASSFDLVLCTQVLEHCPNPQRVVDECHRVLKPGGLLIATAPSIFPEHGYPGDFFRYMPDGFRHLFRAFSHLDIQGELDFAESLASVNCYYGRVLTGRLGKLGTAINPLWHFATNIFGRALSLALRPITHNNFTAFTMNLWVEARK